MYTEKFLGLLWGQIIFEKLACEIFSTDTILILERLPMKYITSNIVLNLKHLLARCMAGDIVVFEKRS